MDKTISFPMQRLIATKTQLQLALNVIIDTKPEDIPAPGGAAAAEESLIAIQNHLEKAILTISNLIH